MWAPFLIRQMSSLQSRSSHTVANRFLSTVSIAAVIPNISRGGTNACILYTTPTKRSHIVWGQESEAAASSVAPAAPIQRSGSVAFSKFVMFHANPAAYNLPQSFSVSLTPPAVQPLQSRKDWLHFSPYKCIPGFHRCYQLPKMWSLTEPFSEGPLNTGA
jgi:hypothetical protein